MIQDIFPNKFDNLWGNFSPTNSDVIIHFSGREILTNDDFDLPVYGLLEQFGFAHDKFEYRYLFNIDGIKYFLLWYKNSIALNGYYYRNARDFRRIKPMYKVLAVYTAMHLNNWYANSVYCGRCGHKLSVGLDERKMVCQNCKNVVYPRLNPAVIAAVKDGDRLLMSRYNAKLHTVRHYVLIAGFVEIGESAEECVKREVLEEVGINVKNIKYFGSQPWGCDGNLTLAYTAELDGQNNITLDDNELSDAKWFQRENVPVPDDDVSITSEMIHQFADGKI